ncbi:MAG TPA: PqqD family protein [Bryobacteraceae bacterium]|nr:PqqD family protein [Bryobacteraceae bacterium]
MPSLSVEALIKPAPHAVSCELSGETVILDTASDRYFALTAIGTQIWDWLQTPCTLAALCERLRQEYDVTPEQCHADVSALLDQLAQHGLITIGE